MASPRKLTSTLAFGLFLVANPMYFVGCGRGYEFDDGDMREVVEELNDESWLVEGYWMQFSLERAEGAADKSAALDSNLSAIATAHACGNRTFVTSASACADTTEMSLEGHLSLTPEQGGETTVLPASGSMHVTGFALDNAMFSLSVGEGEANLGWDKDEDPAFRLGSLQVDAPGADGGEAIAIDYSEGDEEEDL